MKVTHISKSAKDGTRWTVEQMLDDALSQVREHHTTPTKAVVIFLDDLDNKYDVGFKQAGMNMSQIVSLLETAKTIMLKEMGY